MRICERNVSAVESIDFQSLTFFRELVAQFEELRLLDKKDIAESKINSVLSSIIKHHTGLSVTFNFGNIAPSVQIPMVNKNNILINSFIRHYLNNSDGVKMINDAGGVVRGSVNLKTGMVSGIFTEIKSVINIPVEMLTAKSKYTCEEIAAITLHENGHLVAYYEFMTRSVTTNQVLAGLSKALDKSGTVSERESVLVRVKEALNLKDLDTKELAKSTNNKVAEVVIITNVVKKTESELGCNIYDFSTWEYLADQYAARQGAGRHVVTGLEKVYKSYHDISFRSLPVYLAVEALKLILTVFTVFSPIITVLIVMGQVGDNPTYDLPGARFKRIRDQIVENLKDKKLDKDDYERLQADLVAIDCVLKDVNDRRPVLKVIYDAVAIWNYKDRDQKKLQQDLEAIAINELFVKAAELKQVA